MLITMTPTLCGSSFPFIQKPQPDTHKYSKFRIDTARHMFWLSSKSKHFNLGWEHENIYNLKLAF